MRKPLPLLICFAVPAFLLILGCSLAGSYGFRAIPKLLEESGRGLVPDGFELSLDEPGRYTLWLLARGQLGGEFYRSADKLPPGGRIYVYDAATGRQIPLNKWFDATRNVGHERAVALGSFEAPRKGQQIEILGTGLSKAVLVAVTPENTGRVLKVVLSLLGILVLTLSFTIASFLYLLHVRNRMISQERGEEDRSGGGGTDP